MQHVPTATGSAALVGAARPRPAARLVLSAVLSGVFFAAVADGLGMLLHLIGVMPLMP